MRKYEQVMIAVTRLARSLPAGAAIPPERELADELGVSRATLRRAVEDLVTEGYLVRRQGAGTFVAEPRIVKRLWLTSFSEEMRRRGLTPSSRLLSLELVSAGELGTRLDVSPVDKVWRIERLRYADGETMALEEAYLPQAIRDSLEADTLAAHSLYDLLAEAGHVLGSAVQTIQAAVVGEREAELLQVPPFVPALRFERVARSETGQVLELTRSLYRGDRYVVTTELERPAVPWHVGATTASSDGHPQGARA